MSANLLALNPTKTEFFLIGIVTSGPTNLPEMASPAPSIGLQNIIKYYRKVRSEMQKKAYNSEMVQDKAKGKCVAALKASPNFSS